MTRPSADGDFREIYDRHRAAVFAYCARRAARSEALDAAAETFAVAWRRRDDLPKGDATLPWLFAVAHRVLANQSRGALRLSRLRSKVSNEPAYAPERDPAEIVVRAESERELLAAFSRLRSADQEVLRLVTWEELPRDQVAEMLGVTRPALDQRLHRAATRLRKEFARNHAGAASHQLIEGSAL